MSDLAPESADVPAEGADPAGAPEIVDHPPAAPEETGPTNAIAEPAKVMRIGAMIRQLLEEVRTTELDAGGRDRLKEIYETSVAELSETLSPDLREELDRLTPPFDEGEAPSESELRIAQAQLVGWLEGLFHGIQATLMAQQAQAQQQLMQMNSQRGQAQELPKGTPPAGGGVYL